MVEFQVESPQRKIFKNQSQVVFKLLMYKSFESLALRGGTVIFQKYDNYVIYFS